MRAREYAVLLTLALIWGASFYFIKVAVTDVSPATVVFARLLFSVLALGAIIAVRPSLFAGWRRYWRLAIVVGLANNVLPFLLIAWGETRIASGVASILNASTPLFTVVLANWWSSSAYERLTLRRGAGVLLGFAGVAVLVGPEALGLVGGGLPHILGEVAVLVAAASYGIGALLSRRFAGAAPLVAPMTMQCSALLIVLPVALIWSPPTHIPSFAVIRALAILGVVGTGLAYLLFFWLVQHVGATRTAIVTYLLPCTALIWGALLLHERIQFNAIIGLVLILAGTMLVNGTLNGLLARLSPHRRAPTLAPTARPLSAAAVGTPDGE